MTRRLLLLSLLTVFASQLSAANNWPRWRGPLQDGHTTEKSAPTKWSPSDVEWKAELPGFGQSSPVIWGEKIFLTTALDLGKQRVVLCVDRNDGHIIWQKTAWTGEPEPSHNMNYHASATCATDGEHVIAFFGKGGLHCYDVDGNHVWSRDLGSFAGPWGTAASPIILGDMVIQNCDAENDAFLLAVDKKTGKDIWRTPREKLRGWCTPILINSGTRDELILNGERGVHAYDPATGKELWFNKGDTGRGSPTVVAYKDLLIAVNGRPGDMVAMKAGGNGTVNETHEAWRTPRRGGRDLPSPIVVGDTLFVVNLKPGIASCYDAATGTELCKERLSGGFSSSPIAVNGLIYQPNEAGEVFVIRPGKQMEIVAQNKLTEDTEEIFRASLCISDGQLFARSNKTLYCIGMRQK